MVHESLEELEIAGCMHCFVFGKYLIAADAPDAYCNCYHHLMSIPTQHYH